jgi:hypothetical protein
MRTIYRILLAAVLLIAVVYACDYIVLRYRIAKNRNAFGTVTVERYYAIKQKNGKTEFSTGDSQDVTCVNSLFPHSGYAPCWYVSRHPEKQINI